MKTQQSSKVAVAAAVAVNSNKENALPSPPPHPVMMTTTALGKQVGVQNPLTQQNK